MLGVMFDHSQAVGPTTKFAPEPVKAASDICAGGSECKRAEILRSQRSMLFYAGGSEA